MFARLIMFSFIVFFAHQALARPDVQPKVPAEPQQKEIAVEVSSLKGMSHDRLIGPPNGDRIPT